MKNHSQTMIVMIVTAFIVDNVAQFNGNKAYSKTIPHFVINFFVPSFA